MHCARKYTGHFIYISGLHISLHHAIFLSSTEYHNFNSVLQKALQSNPLLFWMQRANSLIENYCFSFPYDGKNHFPFLQAVKSHCPPGKEEHFHRLHFSISHKIKHNFVLYQSCCRNNQEGKIFCSKEVCYTQTCKPVSSHGNPQKSQNWLGDLMLPDFLHVPNWITSCLPSSLLHSHTCISHIQIHTLYTHTHTLLTCIRIHAKSLFSSLHC